MVAVGLVRTGRQAPQPRSGGAEGAGLDSTDECQATLKPAGMGVALTLSVKSSPGFYKGKATVARRSRAVSGLPRSARMPSHASAGGTAARTGQRSCNDAAAAMLSPWKGDAGPRLIPSNI